MNNIIKVSYASCSLIYDFQQLSETEASIGSDVSFHQINHWKKPASMTISDKIENGLRIYQTKLVFKTCIPELAGVRGFAFLAETIDGDRYLIGNNERPYPIITTSENHPDNYADSQLTEYVVTWNSTKKPPVIRY